MDLFQTPERSARPSGVRGTGEPLPAGMVVSTGDAFGAWAATGASAKLLDFPEPIGRIAPGCRSRFIVTEHDPLATVANLHKAKTILFDGAAVECPDNLDAEGL
jgi:hypothetical protein